MTSFLKLESPGSKQSLVLLKRHVETLEHIFWNCIFSQNLWSSVTERTNIRGGEWSSEKWEVSANSSQVSESRTA